MVGCESRSTVPRAEPAAGVWKEGGKEGRLGPIFAQRSSFPRLSNQPQRPQVRHGASMSGRRTRSPLRPQEIKTAAPCIPPGGAPKPRKSPASKRVCSCIFATVPRVGLGALALKSQLRRSGAPDRGGPHQTEPSCSGLFHIPAHWRFREIGGGRGRHTTERWGHGQGINRGGTASLG